MEIVPTGLFRQLTAVLRVEPVVMPPIPEGPGGVTPAHRVDPVDSHAFMPSGEERARLGAFLKAYECLVEVLEALLEAAHSGGLRHFASRSEAPLGALAALFQGPLSATHLAATAPERLRSALSHSAAGSSSLWDVGLRPSGLVFVCAFAPPPESEMAVDTACYDPLGLGATLIELASEAWAGVGCPHDEVKALSWARQTRADWLEFQNRRRLDMLARLAHELHRQDLELRQLDRGLGADA